MTKSSSVPQSWIASRQLDIKCTVHSSIRRYVDDFPAQNGPHTFLIHSKNVHSSIHASCCTVYVDVEGYSVEPVHLCSIQPFGIPLNMTNAGNFWPDKVTPNRMVHQVDDPGDGRLTVLDPWFASVTDPVMSNSILVSSMLTTLSAEKPPVVLCSFTHTTKCSITDKLYCVFWATCVTCLWTMCSLLSHL